MKKIFVIFGTASCLFLANGTNNANAMSSDAVVTYTCPAGCQLNFRHVGSQTYAYCTGSDGNDCSDPTVSIKMELATEQSIAQHDFEPVNIVPQSDTKPTVQKRPVSARAAKVERNVKTATSTPINTEPETQDKVIFGVVDITCPEGCSVDCNPLGNGITCKCRNQNGELCEETVRTKENTIHK